MADDSLSQRARLPTAADNATSICYGRQQAAIEHVYGSTASLISLTSYQSRLSQAWPSPLALGRLLPEVDKLCKVWDHVIISLLLLRLVRSHHSSGRCRI
jgi:hypothetical protein